jgi:UDP-glucose 4-epimerase
MIPVAWVTGARGFIGRHLVRHLHEQGWMVCGVGHGHFPSESWANAGLKKWLNSELTAEAFGELAAEHGPPNFIFHLAGGSAVGSSMRAPYEDFMRTAGTTARLLEWIRTHATGSKVIAVSSAAVYGETGGKPAQESRLPAPVSPYGHHKLIMEQICREYSQVFGLEIVVLRMFSVYGEGLRKQLLWDCGVKLMAAPDSISLGGTGEELRDWIHVDDAVSMMRRAAALAAADCPIFNGGSGRGARVREVVEILRRSIAPKTRLEFSGVRRPGDPQVLVADVSRIAAAGVHCSVPIDGGVKRYADWLKSAGDE